MLNRKKLFGGMANLSNRKDLVGGVALGTVLCCVLCVGAMTTSANVNSQNAAQQAANAASIEKAVSSK